MTLGTVHSFVYLLDPAPVFNLGSEREELGPRNHPGGFWGWCVPAPVHQPLLLGQKPAHCCSPSYREEGKPGTQDPIPTPYDRQVQHLQFPSLKSTGWGSEKGLRLGGPCLNVPVPGKCWPPGAHHLRLPRRQGFSQWCCDRATVPGTPLFKV